MAKRPNKRALRAARTYTIVEAANVVGVSANTIRNWVRAGLPIMRSQRPYLILGATLREFIEERCRERKASLTPDQFYCLKCKAPRQPMGLLVDCVLQSAQTARLVGLCEACGRPCNRMINRAKIEEFTRIFDLAIKDGPTA